MINLFIRKYFIQGIVQGVGFRPFIYHLAIENNLNGWVLNNTEGVTLEIEGTKKDLDQFAKSIISEKPELAVIENINLMGESKSKGKYIQFNIIESKETNIKDALISPDTNVCNNCLNELFDQNNRRYKYPFINCTNCGPRYSIILDLPYDRPNTTMSKFPMCSQCNLEYKDVENRRFHAQPISCWSCGPKILLYDNKGVYVDTDDPIKEVIKQLKDGFIVAVKGIGGYHLMVDPTNSEAVTQLRSRKKRKEKPFALLSESIEQVKTYASLSSEEERLLCSIARPIVIVQKKHNTFSANVATNNCTFGVMLAYTPIQYLLLHGNFTALICTSANISDDAIIYTNDEATKKLTKIADYILIHNRVIQTRLDDSIVKIMDSDKKKPVTFRRARGYIPFPHKFEHPLPSGLALGSELKNTICLNKNNNYFISQHIGDLKNLSIYASFCEIVSSFQKLLAIEPQFIACDLHPNFFNTKFAYQQTKLPVFPIQHHHAHMASCMLENSLKNPVIGVIFDGVGYGTDKSLWGGEFLVGDYLQCERKAHFKQFKLLGGDKAVKEPYRIAFELLYSIYGDKTLDLPLDFIIQYREQLVVLQKMSNKNINSPVTSSVGRIFDGVAAILGLRSVVEYEGQAAIQLEQIATDNFDPLTYVLNNNNDVLEIDFLSAIKELAEYKLKNVSNSKLSMSFHLMLANIVRDVCNEIRSKTFIREVVLSGGVFQNELLLKTCNKVLAENNFKVYSHSTIPPNDGGISAGQAVIAAHQFVYKFGINN
ncbi:MAG: carbamoyltransferase HypF [Bacteroidetes bacterium]|nr:carbamoyltransferase HypF [Bacteroidota bacterium]